MGLKPAYVCALTISNMNISKTRGADRNQILSEASLGWGKACNRFWARLDQNSGFMATDSSQRVIMGKKALPSFLGRF